MIQDRTLLIQKKIDQANCAIADAKHVTDPLTNYDKNYHTLWLQNLLEKFINVVKVYGETKKSLIQSGDILSNLSSKNNSFQGTIKKLNNQIKTLEEQKSKSQLKGTQLEQKLKKLWTQKETINKQRVSEFNKLKIKSNQLQKQLISLKDKMHTLQQQKINANKQKKKYQNIPSSFIRTGKGKFQSKNMFKQKNQEQSAIQNMFEILNQEQNRKIKKFQELQTIIQNIFSNMTKFQENLQIKIKNEKFNRTHNLNEFSFQPEENQIKMNVLYFSAEEPLNHTLDKISNFFKFYQHVINSQLQQLAQHIQNSPYNQNFSSINPEQSQNIFIFRTMAEQYALLASQTFKILVGMNNWAGLKLKNSYDLVTPGIYIDPLTKQTRIQLERYNQAAFQQLNQQISQMRIAQQFYINEIMEIQQKYQQQFQQNERIYKEIQEKGFGLQKELQNIFMGSLQIIDRANNNRQMDL